MLRRAENVQAFYRRSLLGLVTGKYRVFVQVGKREIATQFRIPATEFDAMALAAKETPVAYVTTGERTYWRFADRWYTDNDRLTQAEVHAVLVSRTLREQDRLRHAQTIASQGRLPEVPRRERIADDVKMLVWQRDAGRCQTCGGVSELQFDHIIPVSRGGAGGPENLQILCAPCNRRKGASLV